MKKILLLLLMLCCLSVNVFNASAEGAEYVKVIYSSAYIYADANINADYNLDDENLDILCEVKYGTKLKLLSESILGEDGFNYYNVQISDGQTNLNGYVLCSNVLNINISSPNKELDSNGELNKKAKVYTYENQTYKETGVELASGQKIKILDGYNKSLEFTRIQYADEDGQILTAYVKTEDIKTSGISRSTIGAIIIIVTTVSLVLVIFGIKGKKKKSLKH